MTSDEVLSVFTLLPGIPRLGYSNCLKAIDNGYIFINTINLIYLTICGKLDVQ
jgi:hypothetical protein